MVNRVLLIGSGLSANKVNSFELRRFDLVIAVNNGWRATEDWHLWLHSRDFSGQTPEWEDEDQQHNCEVSEHEFMLQEFGTPDQIGYSIFMIAGYFALQQKKPTDVFFIGFDMNYKPDATGATSIYGVGDDIKKNGVSDPDRMVEVHGKGDPFYLDKLQLRLMRAAISCGTQLWNLSDDPCTRCIFPKYQGTWFNRA